MAGAATGEQSVIPADLLLRAYASGIFPMSEDADDEEIFWVKPQLRGILPLEHFHLPRSLAKTIKRGIFDIRINHDFCGVIDGCASGDGERAQTWINQTIRNSCIELHRIGHAHSVEAWHDGELVGGLYGITLGGAFFGESMFSRKSDASKVCLAALITRLRERGFVLLDTQFTTSHLERFGVIEIPQQDYEVLLAEALTRQASFL